MEQRSMTEEERDVFLSEPRVAILSWLTRAGAPIAAPLWYEWDGMRAYMIAFDGALKLRDLKHDPRASLTVARPAGESEEWVAIDGVASIDGRGGYELSERLAKRYWDMTSEAYRVELDEWYSSADRIFRIVLVPERIRSYMSWV